MSITRKEVKANNSGEDSDPPKKEEAVHEGLDYYVENGLFVFTAAFLLKRGYCCESGCRHCPYGYTAENAAK